jgi:uncharacterized protein Smg (DUF494 family)
MSDRYDACRAYAAAHPNEVEKIREALNQAGFTRCELYEEIAYMLIATYDRETQEEFFKDAPPPEH